MCLQQLSVSIRLISSSETHILLELIKMALFLEQESYLLYIDLDYKNVDYKTYTTILKNHKEKYLRCNHW